MPAVPAEADALRQASLARLKAHFRTLTPPAASECHGFFRARFVGPAWLRWSAPPSLALAGLGGWLGKRFLSVETATNIVRRRGRLQQRLTMRLVAGPSQVDGRDGLALHYLPEGGRAAPVPWRWVRDEVRVLDAQTWLCMTVINLPLLRYFSFPFLLVRAPQQDLPLE